MAAVVGRRDVMEPAAQMFISSTYWSDTIGLQAALTTLREIEHRRVPQQLHELGSNLQIQLTQIAADVGLDATCDGVSFHPRLQFATSDPVTHRQVVTLYIQEMAKRGCHGLPAFYLNAAQQQAEVEQTCDAAREVFSLLAEALEAGQVEARLDCTPRRDVFRRLVR